jgi:hypothetical protein
VQLGIYIPTFRKNLLHLSSEYENKPHGKKEVRCRGEGQQHWNLMAAGGPETVAKLFWNRKASGKINLPTRTRT